VVFCIVRSHNNLSYDHRHSSSSSSLRDGVIQQIGLECRWRSPKLSNESSGCAESTHVGYKGLTVRLLALSRVLGTLLGEGDTAFSHCPVIDNLCVICPSCLDATIAARSVRLLANAKTGPLFLLVLHARPTNLHDL